MLRHAGCCLVFFLAAAALAAPAPPAGSASFIPVIQFPTANRALLERSGESNYFVPTPGKEWSTGTFGCVRTSGWQLHEGLDIRCLQRDARGEPADPVLSCADGRVAYVNSNPALSNFGRYVVIQHLIEGLEIYSTYAHLSAIETSLKPGAMVRGGQRIATMGRSANTAQGISKERAHLHFELNLLVNERFTEWFKRNAPGEKNDHGLWNGRNLVGIDPQAALLGSYRQKNFKLGQLIQQQTELCRVQVQDTSFPWLKRYAALVEPPKFKGPVAGYDLVLNFNGLPFRIIPKSAAEMRKGGAVVLLSVNAAEYQKNPCRRLVRPQAGQWQLTESGRRWIDQICY